jgi:hypothetical protein
MADELGSAAVLLDQSKRALFDMFNEARMGCAVDVRDAMPIVESSPPRCCAIPAH